MGCLYNYINGISISIIKIRKFAWGLLFWILFGTAAYAQLPGEHGYQRTLRSYLGRLRKSDFEEPLAPLTVKASYFSSADAMYRAWLFFGYEQNKMVGTRGLRAPASVFTLNAIEAGGQVKMNVGKSQFMNVVGTAFWADWAYPGNPHYDSRAVKLRAFVGAAVDLMMQDQDHERGHNHRAESLGFQLIRWAYAYGVAKDVLPADVRAAFEKGIIKMVGKLQQWGPTGIEADMDMAAMVGVLYAAKFVDSQDLSGAAHRYIDRLLDQHFAAPGYVDHGSAYDAGYNGISLYFMNWAAQLSEYPPLIRALQQMSTFKAYMTLPDPDGQWFGPFQSNPSSGHDAPHDIWSPYYRDVGLAKYSDDAVYLALKGGHKAIYSESAMLDQMKHMLGYFNGSGQRLAFTTPITKKPGTWKHEDWVDGNALNATAFYYKGGLYGKLKSLQDAHSPLTRPPFSRGGHFTKNFAGKYLSLKRGSYGAIVSTDRLSWWTKQGETQGLNGFGGGNIAAFWTPGTGSVLLGGTRTAHNGGLDLADWRIWPVHALSGQTAGGQAFSSGLERSPQADYALDQATPQVTVRGDLAGTYADPQHALRGRVGYRRVFAVKENGLQVTTAVDAHGANQVKELYELLPVYRRNAYYQSGTAPTAIAFKVNGSWRAGGTSLQTVSSIRLQRFGGTVYIDFRTPQQVKLSPQDFYQEPDTRRQLQSRNIMIRLAGAGPLASASVSYFLRAADAPANTSWHIDTSGGSSGNGDNEEDNGNNNSSDTTSPKVQLSNSPYQPSKGDDLTIKATADDASGVAQIQLFVNNKNVKTCKETKSCSITIGPLQNDSYEYYAIATDNSDAANEYQTKKRTVTVQNEDNSLIGRALPVSLDASLEQNGEDLITKVSNVKNTSEDSLNLVYDWRINQNSIAVVNMPFDVQPSRKSAKVKNYSNYKMNGLVQNTDELPLWTAEGKKGGAFIFDGKDDYVEILSKHEESPIFKDSFTVEVWIDPDNWGENWASIVSKPFSNDYWGDPWAVFKLSRNSNRDNLNFQITVDEKEALSIQSKQDIPSSKWTHIVGTYDGKTLKLYINGELDTSRWIGKKLAENSDTDIFIGKNSNVAEGQEHFKGKIDGVHILNRALSANQIKMDYNGRMNEISKTEITNDEEWQVAVSANNTQQYTKPVNTNSITSGSGLITDQFKPTLKENSNVLVAEIPDSKMPQQYPVNLVYDWQVDSKSIALINMPFNVENSDTTEINNFTSFENGRVNKFSSRPKWISDGKIGGGLEFDGKDDYIEVPVTNNAGELQTFTVETWVKRKNWGDSWATIMSKPFSSTKWENPWGVFNLSRQARTDKLNFQITVGDGQPVSLESKSEIPSDKWTHITGVYDGNTLTLYINGEIDSQKYIGKSLDDPGNTNIFIAKSTTNAADKTPQRFQGQMDEVKLFGVALSKAEVKQHYEGVFNKHDIVKTQKGQEWQVAVSAFMHKDQIVTINTNSIKIGTTNVEASANSKKVDGIKRINEDEITKTQLFQNYPNPFSHSTTIPFDLKSTQKITIKIYDVSGKLVATVFDGQEPAGHRTKSFDALHLTSGIYFYQLVTAGKTYVRKMTFIK